MFGVAGGSTLVCIPLFEGVVRPSGNTLVDNPVVTAIEDKDRSVASTSARRVNCIGVRGEPFGEPVWYVPSGVEIANEGTPRPNESGEPGVFGDLFIGLSSWLRRDAALIHRSLDPGRGGVSGNTLKRSAKWSLMNLSLRQQTIAMLMNIFWLTLITLPSLLLHEPLQSVIVISYRNIVLVRFHQSSTSHFYLSMCPLQLQH